MDTLLIGETKSDQPQSNEMLVLGERGNWSTRRNTSRRIVENKQSQPTYDARSGNQTWVEWLGGECSHHWPIPAPQIPNTYTLRKKINLSSFHLVLFLAVSSSLAI